MPKGFSRHFTRTRFRLAPAIIGLAAVALPIGVAEGGNAGNDAGAGSLIAPPLDPALRGPPLDLSWPKHVYVITDSVMLGAKQAFIRSLSDWEVTYAGRPGLTIRKALPEVRQQRALGPVAVVALGYNSLWPKDRRNLKRWSHQFEQTVEEMLATLKERGARKIVWVTLRELAPEIVPSSSVSVSQYHRYAWYFPYVNERLRAIRERHPEMALADWSGAAHQTGLTYDAIHLNSRGAELMTQVVKAAIGLGDSRPKPATIAVYSSEPPRNSVQGPQQLQPAITAPQPRASAQTSQPVEQDAPVIVRETRIAASGRASPPVERAPIVARGPRATMVERTAPPSDPVPTLAPPRRIAVAELPSPPHEQAPIVRPEPRDTSFLTASIPPSRHAGARGNYMIQLGAFPEEAKARERISEAKTLGKTLLADADPFTEKVIKGRQELYRARFGGFERDAAAAACSYFKRNDIDCVTVLTAAR